MYGTETMLVVTFFCFVAVPGLLAASLNDEWSVFKRQYGKVYGSLAEESSRRDIWAEKAKQIQLHNEAADRGIHSYRMGMNQFGDMTTEEMTVFHQSAGKYTGKNGRNRRTFNPATQAQDLPAEVDWRKKGAVLPVQFQGNCASGYAFASAGSLSGLIAVNGGKLHSFSVQNLVDCSQEEGNDGCSGGNLENSFSYIAFKGIEYNTSYPYEAKQGTCRYDPKKKAAGDNGYQEPESGNESVLKYAVATFGPIATLIDASLPSFTSYSSGVYDDPKCNSTSLNHGMLIVGYGTNQTSGKDYWILQNTYGVNWGLGGYMLLARNEGNRCGVATKSCLPLLG